MMPAAPLISVVIPVYNAAPFLAETLTSVFAQDHRPIEVIVVDDGSTDGSLAIAKAWSPALRIVHQENSGQAAARNRGIELARGPYVAFIDADDLWPPGKLRRHLGLLHSRDDLDLVLGRVELDYQAPAREAARLFRYPGRNVAFFSFGAGLFRRSLFERAGLLSEDLRNTEDADWFMRAKEIGASWLLLDEVALIYRRHGANLTERLPLEKSEVFRVLARSVARRRSRWGAAIPVLDRLTDRRESAEGTSAPGCKPESKG
jgi:glycosyltransferase involved in cell wall biosynthesis